MIRLLTYQLSYNYKTPIIDCYQYLGKESQSMCLWAHHLLDIYRIIMGEIHAYSHSL